MSGARVRPGTSNGGTAAYRHHRLRRAPVRQRSRCDAAWTEARTGADPTVTSASPGILRTVVLRLVELQAISGYTHGQDGRLEGPWCAWVISNGGSWTSCGLPSATS